MSKLTLGFFKRLFKQSLKKKYALQCIFCGGTAKDIGLHWKFVCDKIPTEDRNKL